MTWMRTVRPLVFIGGVLLLVGSLLGARLFSHGAGGGTDSTTKSPTPVANVKDGPGMIVIGYADSDPPPVKYGLPPTLATGQIEQVFVKPGDEVRVRKIRLFGGTIKIGDPLYKFDSSLQEADLKQAEEAIKEARAKLEEAKGAIGTYAIEMDLAQLAVKTAESKVELSAKAYRIFYVNTFESLGSDEKVKNDARTFESYCAKVNAERELDLKRAQLKGLEAARKDKLEPLVAQAEAAVQRTEVLAQKARLVVDLCTVRAKTDGIVERVYARPGEGMGISTREPAVILVPAGPRVVRAEVEAEFAHRIGQDKLRREVLISDHTDPKLTYKGIVTYIPNVFLPRRNSDAGFVPNETRVLEVVVEVAEPNPAGKPPLRVGQKVRVNFGP
jgi:multidrug efflux pump subunit AcrA (membrane-fusion protein)